jgi:flagellar biosynthesis/type III secretory pathway protein FliH
MTHNDQERERYEARLKAERDHHMFFTEGRREAWQEGYQEGFEEGLREALAERLVRMIRVIQRFLGRPVTPAEELLGQPLEELDRLAQELEASGTGEGSPPP